MVIMTIKSSGRGGPLLPLQVADGRGRCAGDPGSAEGARRTRVRRLFPRYYLPIPRPGYPRSVDWPGAPPPPRATPASPRSRAGRRPRTASHFDPTLWPVALQPPGALPAPASRPPHSIDRRVGHRSSSRLPRSIGRRAGRRTPSVVESPIGHRVGHRARKLPNDPAPTRGQGRSRALASKNSPITRWAAPVRGRTPPSEGDFAPRSRTLA